MSRSVVAHLRWDLRQIFRRAVAEGYMERNPAELLFVLRDARRREKGTMTRAEVNLFFEVLELPERVIGGFAILAGLRPCEILALQRKHVDGEYADIAQRS